MTRVSAIHYGARGPPAARPGAGPGTAGEDSRGAPLSSDRPAGSTNLLMRALSTSPSRIAPRTGYKEDKDMRAVAQIHSPTRPPEEDVPLLHKFCTVSTC
ncbi:hypothetical protein U9M48_029635 [Paspalum notatum var. saurae]|uniref:Uncharacterized protein n=1 Tax=Paspalum notatum var. saurae TaxID=547442 RepID=A0AAQ3TZA6_PASNO